MQTLQVKNPNAAVFRLVESMHGAIEVCVKREARMRDSDYAVGLQITAIRDAVDTLKSMRGMKLNKRQKLARELVKIFLDKMRSNSCSRTWEQGLKVGQHKMKQLEKDTVRFLHAVNAVTMDSTPLTAAAATVSRYRNDVEIYG